MDTQKGHLKTLLESNFEEDGDYTVIEKDTNGKGKGKGGNNKKVILLTYDCAKMLCMISKTEKAHVIRKFYVDLEKLIITYKDSIVRDLNNQLEIKLSNKNIIKKNKQKGLVYILALDNTLDIKNIDTTKNMELKIGNSEDLEQRMREYNVGNIYELPIVFAYLTDDYKDLEKCLKECLKRYQIKNNQEKFYIDLEFVKDTIKYCNKSKSILLKQNKNLLKGKDNRKYVIILDTNIENVAALLQPTKNVPKKKTISKKTN